MEVCSGAPYVIISEATETLYLLCLTVCTCASRQFSRRPGIVPRIQLFFEYSKTRICQFELPIYLKYIGWFYVRVPSKIVRIVSARKGFAPDSPPEFSSNAISLMLEKMNLRQGFCDPK